MKVGVLASGWGSNLEAILERADGREGVEVVAVGSDKPDARALEVAAAHGIDTATFLVADHADRAARDDAMAGWLAERGVELVALAGYMALVSPGFLARFPDRVINVHPALLPAFPGVGAIEQALAYGVKLFGVTVHLVDEGVDSGPVILQRSVELTGVRDPDGVRQALAPIEHELLPEAVRLFARGAVRRDPGHPRRMLVGP